MLLIEYVPVLLKNRKLRQIPSFLVFEFELHKLMYVLAGIGTFLSFFHQGSLGGLYGVLRGRPFAFREGIGDLALDVLSVHPVGGGGRTELHAADHLAGPEDHRQTTGQDRTCCSCSGRSPASLLIVYVLLKSLDTMVWINSTSPAVGFPAFEFYAWKPFGTWILFAEIVASAWSRP